MLRRSFLARLGPLAALAPLVLRPDRGEADAAAFYRANRAAMDAPARPKRPARGPCAICGRPSTMRVGTVFAEIAPTSEGVRRFRSGGPRPYCRRHGELRREANLEITVYPVLRARALGLGWNPPYSPCRATDVPTTLPLPRA